MDLAEKVLAATEVAQKALADLSSVLLEVKNSPEFNRVVSPEPTDLNVASYLNDIGRRLPTFDLGDDMLLISFVNYKDPERNIVTDQGDNWFELVKKEGRVSINNLLLIREQLGNQGISMAAAKRIAELILSGYIK